MDDIRKLIDLIEAASTGNKIATPLTEDHYRDTGNIQDIDLTSLVHVVKQACRSGEIDDWKVLGRKIARMVSNQDEARRLASRVWREFQIALKGGTEEEKSIMLQMALGGSGIHGINQPLEEKAPPGMETWIDHRTPDFKDRYGDHWEKVLYATAWKRHRAKKKKKKSKN